GADDLGLERLLKPHGDFIGRALSQRPGLAAPDRLQLVGVRPVDRTLPLRNGLHVLDPEGRAASLGYVTSSTPSVELGSWVGLALVAGGRRRIGRRLTALSPVHGESTEIEIMSSHSLDLDRELVRPGRAAATLMAQVAVILARLPAGLVLLAPASTARHVREWLIATGRPFGLTAGPDVTVAELSAAAPAVGR